VTEGYRLVLTYNLVNADPQKPAKAPAEFDAKAKELENILTFWRDHCREVTSLKAIVYTLQHLYTEENLSLSGLNGCDRLVGNCMSELCKKHGFTFYLARVEYQVVDDCENDESWDEITPVGKKSLELRHIVDLNGTKLLDRIPLETSQIIPEDSFDGDQDEKDFTDTSSNCGVSATRFYHRSVSST
jgi:hypothetical protein